MLYRSKSRGNPLAVDSMAVQANKNRADKRAAVIAVMTCDIVLSCVKEGIRNAIITIRGKPKTKYQYNQERKRDFRVGKSQSKVKTKYEMMTEEQESGTKIVYAMLENDPSRFIRDYKAPIFEDMLRHIHPSFASFATLERIDLSHQQIGDERCEQLFKSITRSPVVFINLAGNELTDVGIRHFAKIQRGLHHLTCLNLSWNLFTDDGFVLLCDREKYHSPTLTQLDVTYNTLSPLSAYHLGALFEGNTHCNLKHSRMGGIVSHGNKTNWGDDFLKQFFAPILKSAQLKRLQVLHLPDAALTDIGVEVIFSWLLCDECNAKELNISKTFLSPRMKDLLPCVLALSPAKDCNLIMVDCGLTISQIQTMQAILSNDNKHAEYRRYMTTRQVLDTIRTTQQALNNCLVARYYFTQQLLNTWKLEAPVRWMEVPPPVIGIFALSSVRAASRAGGQTPSTSSIIKYVVDKRELQEKFVFTMLSQLQGHAGYVHMLQQVLSVMERRPKPDLPHLTTSMTENLSSIVQQMLFVNEQIEELAQWHKSHLRRWTQAVDDAMIQGRDFLTNLYPETNDMTSAKSFLPSIGLSSKKVAKKKTMLTEEDKVTEESLLFQLEEAWVWTQQQGEHDCRWIGLQYKLRLLHFIFIQVSSASITTLGMSSAKGGYAISTKNAMKKQLSSFYSQASSSSAGGMQQPEDGESEKKEASDYRLLLRKMVPCAESGGDLGYFMYYLCTVYPKEKDNSE